MAKSPEAFRTISEVAEWLDTPAHVLRFWESKFTQVKPVKRAGGRRYYRPADMELLAGIKKLLHDDGMTIKGVQKMLSDKGVKAVAALSPAVDEAEIEAEASAPETGEAVSRAVDTPAGAAEAERPAAEGTTSVEVAEDPEPLPDTSVGAAPASRRDGLGAPLDSSEHETEAPAAAGEPGAPAEAALDPGALPEPPADPRADLDVPGAGREHVEAPDIDTATDEDAPEGERDKTPGTKPGLDVATGTETAPETAEIGADAPTVSDPAAPAMDDEAPTGFTDTPEAPVEDDTGTGALDTSQGELFKVAANHVPSFLSTPLAERPGGAEAEPKGDEETRSPASPQDHTEVDTGLAEVDMSSPSEAPAPSDAEPEQLAGIAETGRDHVAPTEPDEAAARHVPPESGAPGADMSLPETAPVSAEGPSSAPPEPDDAPEDTVDLSGPGIEKRHPSVPSGSAPPRNADALPDAGPEEEAPSADAAPAIAAVAESPAPEDLPPPPPGALFHAARIGRLTAAQAARIAPLVEQLRAFRDR